jgi:hypothetical protein
MENQIINSPLSQSKQNPALISSRQELSNEKSPKIYDSVEIKINQNPNLSSNRILNSEKGNFQTNISTQRDIIDQDLIIISSNYSFCIFCRMIPLISNLFPCFSHLYIISSKGSTHDFDSSRFVEVKNKIDKLPLKYIQLHLTEKDKLEWDRAIMKIDKIFQKKEFGICGNNSYSYIASFLNEIQYNGRNNYTEKDIFSIYIKESKYISSKGVIFNYLTLIIIAILIIIIIILSA